MTDNTKDYELKIAITENGSRVQTINTKDNLRLELYTNKGYLQITFTKWNEDGKVNHENINEKLCRKNDE